MSEYEQSLHEPMTDPLERISGVTSRLLESSVVYSEHSRRSQFELGADQAMEIYQYMDEVGLMRFLRGHMELGSGSPYNADFPTGIGIFAEEVTHADGNLKSNLELYFRYRRSDEDFYSIGLSFNSKDTIVRSHVYDPQFDMGGEYAGHSFRSKEASVREYLLFADIIEQYSNTTENVAQSRSDFFAKIKMVNGATGEEFFYDPSTQGWRSVEGKDMGDGTKDEYAEYLRGEGVSFIREVASYSLVQIEIEENPFLTSDPQDAT